MCIRALHGVSIASSEVGSWTASSGITTAEVPSISAMYGATNASEAEIATFMLLGTESVRAIMSVSVTRTSQLDEH